MIRRGFTVVELLITITIMGILLTLAVVAISSTQTKARDDERKTDVETLGIELERIYTNGIAADSSGSIKNLFVNPSAEASTSYFFGLSSNVSTSSAWSSHGSSSAVVTPNSGSSDTSFMIIDSSIPSLQNGTEVSKTYTASGTIHLDAPQTGSLDTRARRIMFFTQTPSGYTSVASAQAPNAAGTTRLSVTATVPADAFEVFVRFYNGASSGNGIVYWDSMMLTEGSTAYDYNDGNSSGWSWTGTANMSISTGPAITNNYSRTYPSTVLLASSTTLETIMSDVNPKIFLPPGVTDQMAGFVIATNSNQTVGGVSPQPTTSQYVYQPIDSQGNLCTDMSDCRKFNLYYRLEGDGLVHMVTSKNR